MQSHSKRFDKWIRSAPDHERSLRRIAIEFEDKHFRDMQLLHASASRRLFTADWADDRGNWRTCVSDAPSISLADDWIFRLAVPPSQQGESYVVLGECQTDKQTIWINSTIEQDHLLQPATLLHEMIHAYEGQLTTPLREWLAFDLYNRMLKTIPRTRLHRMIDASVHYVVHNAAHGVLFLLKSLDIDMRYRWPAGTTFGYGRADMMQGAIRRPKRKATA